MTALASAKPPRGPRPILQAVFVTTALAVLAPIGGALVATVARGRPLPWQFHMPWVGPHLAAALIALALGAVQLGLKKGDRRHRMLGYAWLAIIAYICVSGLLIQLEPGHVTIIHMASSAFAVADLLLLPLIVWSARTGRRRLHKGAVLALFAGMLSAGLQAFIPWRTGGLLIAGLFH